MMKVFEACSFQDITGQRITKVVNTVEVIEERINILCQMMDNNASIVEPVLSDSEKEKKKQLLSGPSSNGVNQNEIDAMF